MGCGGFGGSGNINLPMRERQESISAPRTDNEPIEYGDSNEEEEEKLDFFYIKISEILSSPSLSSQSGNFPESD